jgi:8-oxo-dGTP pyrophosphatase MutT (NUDIX family)
MAFGIGPAYRRTMARVTAAWDRLDGLPPVAAPAGMRAAVLVPLYEAGGVLRLILTRRPDDMRTHAGDVVFPGGIIEPGDSGPVDTAVREAWEEIGLPPDHVTVLGGLDPVTTRSREMLIVPVVARVRRPVELIPEPGEVDAIIEPAVDDLLDDARWRTEEWAGHELWFYEFPEGVLWGATARLVRSLLGLFR